MFGFFYLIGLVTAFKRPGGFTSHLYFGRETQQAESEGPEFIPSITAQKPSDVYD